MRKISDLEYIAEEGYTFVYKQTGIRYGDEIFLGNASIVEFEEQPMTDKEKQVLNKVLDAEDGLLRKIKEEKRNQATEMAVNEEKPTLLNRMINLFS